MNYRLAFVASVAAIMGGLSACRHTPPPAQMPALHPPEFVYEITDPAIDQATVIQQVTKRLDRLHATIAASGTRRISVSLPPDAKSDAGESVRPQDLDRLLLTPNQLDFRIAVGAESIGGMNSGMYRDILERFRRLGPAASVTLADGPAQWFKIAPFGGGSFFQGDPSMVVASWQDHRYILCYDDSLHTLTHQDTTKKSWTVTLGKLHKDSDGPPLVPFYLDVAGARYMSDISTRYLHHAMALFLNDEVIAAPTIQSPISNSGAITLGFAVTPNPEEEIEKVTEDFRKALGDSPSLPLRRLP